MSGDDRDMTGAKALLAELRDTEWYQELLEGCRDEVIHGQKELAITYWRIGKLLEEDYFSRTTRKERYGRKVIQDLSEELGVKAGNLYKARQFYRAFPVFPKQEHRQYDLCWTHYRDTLSLSQRLRQRLLKEAGLRVTYVLHPAQGHSIWFPQLHRYRCHPLELAMRLVDDLGGKFQQGEVLVVFAQKE